MEVPVEGGVVDVDVIVAVVKLSGDSEGEMFVERPSVEGDRRLLLFGLALACAVSPGSNVLVLGFELRDCSADD
jgi:hypothetical protein